jgi:hypothetical protein
MLSKSIVKEKKYTKCANSTNFSSKSPIADAIDLEHIFKMYYKKNIINETQELSFPFNLPKKQNVLKNRLSNMNDMKKIKNARRQNIMTNKF